MTKRSDGAAGSRPDGRQSLGEMLRALRKAAALTQRDVEAGFVAAGRRVSNSTVSLWERDEQAPDDERLAVYARLVGADVDALHEARRRTWGSEPSPGADVQQQTFWQFDDQPVHVACTPMYERQLRSTPYADPDHPNFIGSLLNADMDAVLLLADHLPRVGSAVRVEYLTYDRLGSEATRGHLVVLGSADTMLDPGSVPAESSAESAAGSSGSGETLDSALSEHLRNLGLPIRVRLPEGGDDEYDMEFVVTRREGDRVTETVHRPEFETEVVDGKVRRATVRSQKAREWFFPRIRSDVALVVRAPNPLAPGATVTICSGVFSRGTYGAVLATTDAEKAQRNEAFLRRRFGTPEGGADAFPSFWMLVRVPVLQVGGRLVTGAPDFETAFLDGDTL